LSSDHYVLLQHQAGLNTFQAYKVTRFTQDNVAMLESNANVVPTDDTATPSKKLVPGVDSGVKLVEVGTWTGAP
jgi:hypothetical protein